MMNAVSTLLGMSVGREARIRLHDGIRIPPGGFAGGACLVRSVHPEYVVVVPKGPGDPGPVNVPIGFVRLAVVSCRKP